MNHLIEKPSLTIEPTLAKTIGLNESIFIKQLHYWLNKTKHTRDNQKWVFNTILQWQDQFPFWSEKTIRRIIENLKKDNWIQVEKHDTNPLNRTNWYTINYEKIEQLKLEINPEIPIVISEEKKETPTKQKTNEGAKISYSEKFVMFWESYPKKDGKRQALLEFEKLNEEQQEKAVYGAKKYGLEKDDTEPKYIKTGKNWLKEGYFEDYEIRKDEIVQTDILKVIVELERKILKLIEVEAPQEIDIWNQKENGEMIFSLNEQEILKELNNELSTYIEMEFQKGEIKRYLQGAIR